ncbi:glycosyltransferase [Candidatus Micrarchaeota archaeon]|jgi:GT2 family glycosyltransferase|nr:glycosyltransferase [Candidatus Micrarchaeota archaeon]
MSRTNFISIILPTYNRTDSLKDCIKSVVNQSYKNWELLVIDDSTTKDVGNFVKKQIEIDQRIKYHKNNVRKGLPGSRNVGIDLSKHSYILFIEDDIIMKSDSLEILVSAMMKLKNVKKLGAITPSRPWVGRCEFSDDILKFAIRHKNINLAVPSSRSALTGIVYSNFVPEFATLQEVPDVHACSMYARNVFETVGKYDENTYKGNFLYEETDLNYRIAKSGYKFFFEPKAILYHKSTQDGGCRVNVNKYAYYYILNHAKYVGKNYGFRSFYMIPSFLVIMAYTGIKSVLLNSLNSQRRG